MSSKSSNETRRRIKALKEAHEIGKDVLNQCDTYSQPGRISELAAKYGLTRDKCQKLRQMANPKTGYTKQQLEKWYKYFRKGGLALTVTHFVKLVSVPTRNHRDRLTRKAVKQKWSTQQLQREILKLSGRRMRGGRKPVIVTGDGFASELESQLYSWSRWLGYHLEANADMEPMLRGELNEVKQRLEGIHNILADE